MQTFVGKLTKNHTCTVRVTDDPPAPGRPHILDVQWSLPPTRVVAKRYLRWMVQVNQQLADQWNHSLAYVFQLGPRPSEWITYTFTPGGEPERL